MANLSSKTGFTPVQTRVTLANNATTSVQEFAAYDGQELTGFVFIDATTDYRATVKIQVVKNGAGTYEVAAADIAGDDNGGSPIVSFSMSGSVLRATLVSYAGFVSAYIQYNLNAPALGANFPMTVDASNVSGSLTARGSIPLGSVIATFPHLTGAYSTVATTTPDSQGFVLCQGQTLVSGPMSGAVIPNINNNAFLRGNATSSATLNSSATRTLVAGNIPTLASTGTTVANSSGTFDATHSHTITDPGHGHNASIQGRVLGSGGDAALSGLSGQNIGFPGTVPVFNSSTGITGANSQGTGSGGSLNHSHSIPSLTVNASYTNGSPTALNIEPTYINAVYLMRAN